MARPIPRTMLLFKAWKESRTRFLISAGMIALFCVGVVVFNDPIRSHGVGLPHAFEGSTYSEHVYRYIYSGTAKGIYSILVLFIGLGGLLRERRRGTAPFTLSLPITRTELIGAQLVVGLAEIVALSLLPLAIIPALSALMQQSYPLNESLHFAVLWLFGGMLYFSIAFLCSVLFAGEYTALVAAYLVLFTIPLTGEIRMLAPYRPNPLWIMGEFDTMHWDAMHSMLLPSPLSWVRMLVFALIAATLLGLSLGITRKQDF